jgi:hypothetical protein
MSDFPEEQPEFEEPGDELARLARETIDSQSGTIDMVSARRRCQRVIDMYNNGDILDGRDYFHAAWVMLCGENLAHFELARNFAQQATELDEDRAWTLRAMAWDRWLVAMGRPQRFGTQIVKQRGRWSLGEVDPQINDHQRALYAVPPLFIQTQRAEQLQRQEDERS